MIIKLNDERKVCSVNNSQEYIFALVRFMENAKQYAYLSNDSRIKKDDVVLVSTPKGDNLGIVWLELPPDKCALYRLLHRDAR